MSTKAPQAAERGGTKIYLELIACLLVVYGILRVRETGAKVYFTITQSLPLRPNTSGEYISSALAGGATKRPGVVALVI